MSLGILKREFFLPRLLEQGRTVCQEDRLHHEEHLGQALQFAVGLSQIVEDVLRCRLRLLAEEGGHRYSCPVTVKDVSLEGPGSQSDRWDVIPGIKE